MCMAKAEKVFMCTQARLVIVFLAPDQVKLVAANLKLNLREEGVCGATCREMCSW